MIPTSYFIILSAILFTLGVLGVLVRRNTLILFMSAELMLNSANLALVAFARQWLNHTGQVFVLFIMVVAATEVAVGLALIVSIFRRKHSVDVDAVSQLKG